MVTVIVKGGLGNQMFQYALGLTLAKRNGAAFVLDTAYLNDRTPRRQFTHYTYDLGAFPVPARFTFLSRVSNAVPVPLVWVGLDLGLRKLRDLAGIEKLYLERSPAFDPGLLSEKHVSLFGYFQSWKYFSETEPEVRRAFTFSRPLEGAAAALAERIVSCESVGVHVRRGDYTLSANVALFGATNERYYEEAIRYAQRNVPRARFFVFSNDLEWCKANLHFSYPPTFVGQEYSGYRNSGHLRLLSLCKTHIIANSTFSWWAAWLHPFVNRLVIAPAAWEKGRATDDLLPPEWVKL